MKKNKILRMLSVTIALTLFGNIVAFATKNKKNQIQNKGQLEQIKDVNPLNRKTKQENSVAKIEGVEFKKLFTTPQQVTPYFNENRRTLTVADPKAERTGMTIAFAMKVEDNKGKPHALEHLLISNNLGEKPPWKSLPEEISKNANSGINAHTTMFDLDNDIALVVINIDEDTLKDEKKMEYLGKQLTGFADFLSDNRVTYNREILNKLSGEITSRILLEMYGKENPSKDDEQGLYFKEQKDIWKMFSYDSGGVYKEMLNNNFEDLKKYYFENIVGNKPIIYLRVKNLKDANEPIRLLEKFYFSKRKNNETKNLIKENKEKEKYFRIDVSPIYAQRKGLFTYFEVKDGVSSPRKSESNITVEYTIPNVTNKKIGAINCLKPCFVKEMFDEKNCPFLDIYFFTEDNKLKLNIFPKDKNIIKKEEVEKLVEDISTKIIEYLEKNKIQKANIDEEMLNNWKNGIKNKTFNNFYKFCDNITKSYLVDNRPFSEKYFLVDKNGQFENNAEEFEKYSLNNCVDILKETLKENKKRILFYRLNKEKIDEKKEPIIKNSNKSVFFPFTYKEEYLKEENRAVLDIANEILICLVLNKGLNEPGLIYNNIDDGPIKGKISYFPGTEKLEKQNIKKFFESGAFRKLLNNLKKEIKGSSKDKFIQEKINYFKNTLLDNMENSLKNGQEKMKNYIEHLEKIKKIDKLTRDHITDQEQSQESLKGLLNLMHCADTIIKYDEKYLIERKKKINKADKEAFENQKRLTKAINTRTKEDIRNNVIDGEPKKVFHEKLDLLIKELNDQIANFNKYIEEIGKIKKQANSLKVENIKEALRSIEEKKFSEMNK